MQARACSWVLVFGFGCTGGEPPDGARAVPASAVTPGAVVPASAAVPAAAAPAAGDGLRPTVQDLSPDALGDGEEAGPPASEELRARTGFPRPPRGAAENCGPERRFAVAAVDSAAGFVERLRGLQGDEAEDPSSRLQPDDFRRPAPRRVENGRRKDGGEIDWAAVERAVTREEEGGVTYHRLRYAPVTCSGYTLTMTSTGAASLYGCCGK